MSNKLYLITTATNTNSRPFVSNYIVQGMGALEDKVRELLTNRPNVRFHLVLREESSFEYCDNEDDFYFSYRPYTLGERI